LFVRVQVKDLCGDYRRIRPRFGFFFPNLSDQDSIPGGCWGFFSSTPCLDTL